MLKRHKFFSGYINAAHSCFRSLRQNDKAVEDMTSTVMFSLVSSHRCRFTCFQLLRYILQILLRLVQFVLCFLQFFSNFFVIVRHRIQFLRQLRYNIVQGR